MGEKNINFEDSMEKLQNIAKQLEDDNLSLDESIKLFEQGMDISKKCKEMLDKAEKKIKILVGDDEEDFEIDN